MIILTICQSARLGRIQTMPVTSDDVRDIFRLIHEVCELGADAHAWRAHFQKRIMAMVDSTFASAFVMRLSLEPGGIKPAMELRVETGTNEAWRQFYSQGDVTVNPITPGIMARFGTDFTCTRQELVDDDVWYSSDFYRRVGVPSDYDQHLVSQVCIQPPGVVDGFGLARPVGAPPFGSREIEIIRMAHQELAFLWRRPDPLGVNALPKRLRQTLHCIRRAMGRKEIATELNISAHTAHAYEKALFTRYGVAGRAELMALLAASIQPTLLPLEQDNDYFLDGDESPPS
jgi:DNA-binding CsgD family transcriptional regulator